MSPTTPSADDSPAPDAGEVVAWRWRFVMYEDGWNFVGKQPMWAEGSGGTVIEPLVRKSALDAANARADALERELAEYIAGTDKLFAAQNGVVNEVWTLLGGQDDTRPGGSNLVGRVREFVARAEAAESRLAKAAEERDEARRLAADRSYMLDAYLNMLGENGLKVAEMWKANGVQRLHFEWGPKAWELTGEQRAEMILDIDLTNSSWG